MPDYPFTMALVCILPLTYMNNNKEQQREKKIHRQHTDIFFSVDYDGREK